MWAASHFPPQNIAACTILHEYRHGTAPQSTFCHKISQALLHSFRGLHVMSARGHADFSTLQAWSVTLFVLTGRGATGAASRWTYTRRRAATSCAACQTGWTSSSKTSGPGSWRSGASDPRCQPILSYIIGQLSKEHATAGHRESRTAQLTHAAPYT